MIRILLDECMPVKLRYRFQEFDESLVISTVNDENWNGIKNGKLLGLAEANFDVFITIDQSIPYQQTVANFSISLIALRPKSNRYKDILPFVKPIVQMLKNCKTGIVYKIPPFST